MASTSNFRWRPFGYVAVICVAGVFAAVVYRGPQGIPTLLDKWSQVRQLQEENASLAREVQMKRERIERLKVSQADQELEIRKRLEMLRPGETDFKIQPQPDDKDAEKKPVEN